jgi:heme exporter protein D
VLNIFLSVLITGFSVYWALTSFHTPDILVSSVSSLWRGQPPSEPSANRVSRGASEPVRVLVSLFAALMVGVAEVLIYAIYLQKVDQARARERRIKERKEVVESDVVGGRAGKTDKEGIQKIDGEQETIWGRGANGGVRRRVREKWEKESQRNIDNVG